MKIFSSHDILSVMNWGSAIEALREAHAGQRPSGDSYFIGDASYELFSRDVLFQGYRVLR
ncbi:hypothetical protein PS706_04203 [Pseudomonas fluorescens]|nr:hypothetical protein FX984_00401 [Pseudomonas marginalis]VVO20338.1 hypothetical protein PS706_04203 [Pseudomonas fluorescens]